MAVGLLAGLAGAQAVLGIASGFSGKSAYELQAKQATLDAKSAELDRRRELQDALAMQAVISAAGGRAGGVGSVEAIRKADIRRAEQDIAMIQSGGRAEAASLKAAGGAELFGSITSGLLSAGTAVSKIKQVK